MPKLWINYKETDFRNGPKGPVSLIGGRKVELTCRLERRFATLEETEHFRRWPQKQVAKIVQCGE